MVGWWPKSILYSGLIKCKQRDNQFLWALSFYTAYFKNNLGFGVNVSYSKMPPIIGCLIARHPDYRPIVRFLNRCSPP
jgi:hypothetical protein